DGDDLLSEVALAFNSAIGRNEALVTELARVTQAVGGAGQTSERASLGSAGGGWAYAVDNVNTLIEKTTWPLIDATTVLTMVADGDLSSDVSLSHDGQRLQGDFHALAVAVRALLLRLRTVTASVSHVVREMGTEGKLGVEVRVDDARGTWRQLISDVN